MLVFATERKNNEIAEEGEKRSASCFLPSNWCTSDVSNIYE